MTLSPCAGRGALWLAAALFALPSSAQGLAASEAATSEATPHVLRTDRPEAAPASVWRPAVDFVVAGRVIGADDRQPLPGVNVVVAGTTIGMATGIDGRYELTAPSETDSLRFSFVGYETQIVPILGRSEIDVTLRPEAYQGDEVIVIGYGTTEVRDLTGSVGAITAEEIEGKPLVSFEEALAGRVAGVNVQQNSGDLQGNFQIDVRGVGSFGSTNRPLYIVDGIPLEPTDNSFLATLNPDDVESISVLKDASSASIYGVRAADGVVIITTKSGAGQEPTIELSTSFNAASPVRTLDMLNSAEMAQYRIDALVNGGTPEDRIAGISLLTDPAFLAANDTDWQDAVTQTGLAQEYNVSARGSSGPVQFSASGNYEDVEGRIIGSEIQRASIRLNSVVDLSERATLDVRLNGARQWGDVVVNDNTFGASLRDALYKYPWESPYDANGEFAEYFSADADTNAIYSQPFPQNPVADLLENERSRQWQQFIATTALTYRFPFGFRYRGSASANLSSNTADDFFPTRDRARQLREVVSVAAFDQLGYNYFTDHTLTFDREFGVHDVEVLGGMSFQEDYLEFTFAQGTGGTNNALTQVSLQPEQTGTSAREQAQRLLSYFSRLTYDFDDRYFITGTVRADGSSKFSPERRWAVLPAVGLAWRISSESFMRDVQLINDLKLRLSYGLLGDREGVGDNAFLTRVGTGFVAFGESPVQQAPLSNVALPDGVGWETIQQLDLGLDLTVLRGRFGLTFDYYDRFTEDVLGSVPAPPAFPVGSISGNLASVRNRGIEVALNGTPVLGDRVQWRTTVTFGYNQNEVENIRADVLGEGGSITGRNLNAGPLQFGTVNQTIVGRTIGDLWGWDFLGICSTEQYDEATDSCGGLTARSGVNGVRPGDTLYRDVNGDGIIDDADRVFLGSGIPKAFGGFTNVLSVGAFEFETLFTYALGRKLFDTSLMFGISGDSNINKRADVLDRWTPENQDTDIPRAFQGRRGYINALPSDFFIQSADFLRLRTLRLTYTLPGRFAGVVGARSAQLSFIGTNLLTFTGYSGLDPEASSGARSGSGNLDAASAPLSPGLDLTTYPIAKTVGFRLNVTL